MKKAAFILIFIFSFSVFSQTKPLDKKVTDNIYKSLEKSDTQLALDSVLQTFYAFDVRWHPKLTWVWNPYNDKINQYKNHDKQIKFSQLPKKSQAADYWANWSKLLTDGKFNYKKFFKNEREMLLMANYNQLILATHEFGHHLDYLYNISTYGGEGFAAVTTHSPLNCTEGFADQIAFVFVSHLAQDARFAELRQRYLELINEIDQLIPEKNRASFTGISSVLEGCGKVEYAEDMMKFNAIENNEDFRRYVSVYFNRWRIMLTQKDFPPMNDFLETRIFQPFYKRLKLNDTPVSVKTISEIDLPKFEEKSKDGVYLAQLEILNKDGDFRNFVLNFKTQKTGDRNSEDWQSGEIELQNDKLQPMGKVTLTLPENYKFPYYPAIFAMDDNEFYFYLSPALNFEQDAETLCQNRLLYQFRRVNNVWQEKLEVIKNEKYYCLDDERLISSPNGKLYLINFKGESSFAGLADQNSTKQTQIFLTEIDRETLKLKESKTYGTFTIADFPKLSRFAATAAITDDGKLLMPFVNTPTTEFQIGSLAEVQPNGEVTTLAGTVINHEDGNNKHLIGFTNILDIRQIDAKTIRVLDWKTKNSGRYVREIKLQ